MLPQPHPAVIFKTVSEGAVLLHTESEVYFGLNHVGAQVWRLVTEGASGLDDLVSGLSDTYPDVAAGVIRDDVAALLAELTENGLLVSAGSDDAAPQTVP